jgi:hypothetical protein
MLVHARIRMNGAGPFVYDPLDSVSAAAALRAASEALADGSRVRFVLRSDSSWHWAGASLRCRISRPNAPRNNQDAACSYEPMPKP